MKHPHPLRFESAEAAQAFLENGRTDGMVHPFRQVGEQRFELNQPQYDEAPFEIQHIVIDRRTL